MQLPRSLCTFCNSSRTQAFDRAYDRFVEWVSENEPIVQRRRMIDFAAVYGEGFSAGQLNLFRYFAKCIGCQVAASGVEVPADIPRLMVRAPFKTGLRLTLSVDERVETILGEHGRSLLHNGPLYADLFKAKLSRAKTLRWQQHVGGLAINYWYNIHPDGLTGCTWVADSRHLYLGAVAGEG